MCNAETYADTVLATTAVAGDAPDQQGTLAARTPQTAKRRFRGRKRRGAAAVEFAVVAIPFFLLVFGMFEIGRMMMVRQVLTNASREGARAVILESATVANVETMVTNYTASCAVPGVTATCSFGAPDLNSVGPKEPITVTVSVPFSSVSWMPGAWFFNGSDVITASAVMGREVLE